MHETIENIIKKNLPEKKEIKEPTEIDGIFRGLQVMQQKVDESFNQALSKINPSLIADEVLKVVVEKIRELSYERLATMGGKFKDLISKDEVLQLLSNLEDK